MATTTKFNTKLKKTIKNKSLVSDCGKELVINSYANVIKSNYCDFMCISIIL